MKREPTTLDDARRYKKELITSMFGPTAAALAAGGAAPPMFDAVPQGSNIVGVGYGVKETLGETLQSETAVRVYVRTKLPRAALASAEIVPSTVQGLPTDVLAVGDINAFVTCGVSIGHPLITAGTAGCLAHKPGSQDLFVLSNNHVLANSSDVAVGVAGGPCAVGDVILQPGPLDSGKVPQDVVAALESWVPLDFTGASNEVDAAIARVTRIGHFTPNLPVIGNVVQPPVAAALYQSVRKWGRTTNHTIGVVTDLAASIRVRYGTKLAQFDDQLGIQGIGAAPFSMGGDSGSLIVDAVTKQPLGLLFAGGGALTFANVIADVLNHPAIGVTIV